MAQKIILFLSELREHAQEVEYHCPDGSGVTGIQTNEAPVKYLLHRHPKISEILCIVTPTAEQSAWMLFQTSVAQTAAKVKCTLIPFRGETDFQGEVLPQILSRTEDGDEIFLETTGGLRNAVMYLLLISRALSYAGVKTAGAVYSNYNQKEIEDISHLISLFDFIGGMQELTAFGNARSLRSYYERREHSVEIDGLLDAVDKLWECITLCRARQIPQRMEQFNQALERAEVCSDPLMRALLPAFRKKFGKRLTTPGLIKWCVQSDMLQQALTVYKERIPIYIMSERDDILNAVPNAPKPNMQKDYVSEEEARFYEHFLKMGRNMRKAYYGMEVDTYNGDQKDYTVTTLEHLEALMPHSFFVTKYSIDRLRTIVMDYLYIRAIRNMTNHANDQENDSQKQLMEYLNQDPAYKRLNELKAEDIRRTILTALEHLQPLPKKERVK